MKNKHKYSRGDKFIIEIAEVHTHYKDNGDKYPLYRVKGFDSMVLTNIALDKFEKPAESEWVDIVKELPSIEFSCTCGKCGERERMSKIFSFCPNCGAKMRNSN